MGIPPSFSSFFGVFRPFPVAIKVGLVVYDCGGEYLARELFISDGRMSIKSMLSAYPDARERRLYLVQNIRGMGWKEASHFLRNTGFGEDFAILDRHVLKNLSLLGVIPEIPRSLGPKRYLEIESLMAAFASSIRIPLAHLDYVLWYKEAGSVFK